MNFHVRAQTLQPVKTCGQDLKLGARMQGEEELFREVELPGKGTGLVASCDLQPGVLLLAEAPLLTVPWWQRLTQFNRLTFGDTSHPF